MSIAAQTITRTILFIDTEPNSLASLKELFLPAFIVYIAKTGDSAHYLFLDKQPDLIVCDIVLPDISGFELCQLFKQLKPGIPIVFLTSQNNQAIKIKALESLAVSYIDKERDDYEIFLRIRNLLSHTNPFNHASDCTSKKENHQGIGKQLDKAFNAYYFYSDSVYNQATISCIAKEIAMSERSLQRKVKQETGQTFTQYHQAFRLKKAEELLIQGCSSTEIAKTLGYSNSAYFASCFKQQFKITPSQYKKALL